MKSILLALLLIVPSLSAQAREFFINLNYRQVWQGSTVNLKAEIDSQTRRFDFHDHKITHVEIEAKSLVGRYGDFRRPTAGAYLRVKDQGGCGTTEVKFERRFMDTRRLDNPNNRNISDGDWVVGFCGKMEIASIRVFTERRRQGGGGHNGGGHHGGGHHGPKNLKMDFKAGWSPIYSVERVNTDAHTIVISNPINNRNKVQIDSIRVEIETRGGRDSMFLDLSHYRGEYLKPAQKLEIEMPVSRRGNEIRRIISFEIELESWERNGEWIEVEFDQTTGRRGGRR